MTNRLGDDEEDAGIIMVYDAGDVHVGIHHLEGEEGDEGPVVQSIGKTREDVVEDMLLTLNHAPDALQKVRDDDAELVDVVPLSRSEDDEGGEQA